MSNRLRRAFEALEPGGELRIFEIHPDVYDAGSRARVEKGGEVFYTAAHRHDAAELMAAAGAAGFTSGSVEDVWPSEDLERRYPSTKRADLPWLLAGAWTR